MSVSEDIVMDGPDPPGDASFGSTASSPAPPQVQLTVDDPFDWEAYIANYTGYTKIQRCLHIAKSLPSVRAPAADLAAQLIKDETQDTTTYNHALNVRNTDADAVPLPRSQKQAVDTDWIARTEAANRTELEKLDLELRNYQNNLIKESIRMANRDLANHYKRRGNLIEANKFFQRSRDFCQTTEHIVDMCLNVIEVSAV